MNTRRATLEDIPWMIEQLMALNECYGSSHSLFPDEDAATGILQEIIGTQPVVIAELVDGTPVGFIAGAIHNHPYNPDLIVLSEMFWWVVEKYRGSKASLLLLNEFIAIGERSAHWTIMTVTSETKVDPAHLYSRGFRFKETSYLREAA